MSRLYRSSWLLLALAAGPSSAIAGCAQHDHGEQADPANAVGSVGLNLEVAPGVTVSSVTYAITGNGLAKTGAIDVDQAPVIQARIGGIPAGKGYTITLSASGTDGGTATGSASFDVTAGATTGVTINLNWSRVSPNGSLEVTGLLEDCPKIDELTVQPAEAIVGHAIHLHAVGSHLGDAPLSYAWTASGGSLSNASSPDASLTSASAGDQSVTLAVSDGSCTARSAVTVHFVAGAGAPDAGSPGSGYTLDGGSSGGALPDASETAPDAGGVEADAGAQNPPSVVNTLALVATSTTPNTAATPSVVVSVPPGVRPDDLAVVILVDSGTVTLTSSPSSFTTTNLAASNHVVSYGLVGAASSLSWTFSGSPNTGATTYFFRGHDLSVEVIGSSSTSGTSYGLDASTQGPAEFDLGYALFSVQLAVSSTPTIASGPGGAWQGPLTDGKQLYTWSQPYDFEPTTGFVFPAAAGTLSASSTKRQAQVFVYGSR